MACFVPNGGQWPDSIRFATQLDGCRWWFTDNGFYADLIGGADSHVDSSWGGLLQADACGRLQSLAHKTQSQRMLVSIQFAGRNSDCRPQAAQRGEPCYSFLIGDDTAAWVKSLPVYGELRYEEVYAGVTLRFFEAQGKLEYDLIVQPGAGLSQVLFEVDGVLGLSLDEAGKLRFELSGAELTQALPTVYQLHDSVASRCSSGYRLIGTRSFTFSLGDDCDAEHLAVIDPVLSYSSYLGGSGHDHGRAIAVDDFGDVYVLGETESFDFPTVSCAFDTGGGQRDLFVTKLKSDGQNIVYSTYIGGSGIEEAGGIALDAAGRAYIAGTTTSTDFAVTAAIQPQLAGGQDCFLLALEHDGRALMYSTYLGGSGEDGVGGLAVDQYGNAHLAGYTTSADYPLKNALQKNRLGPQDAVITKLSRDGSSLVFSTYLGGSADDGAADVAVDNQGDIYVVGNTGSTDFPIRHALRNGSAGQQDAWLVKLDRSGSRLQFGTYLGGSGDDFAASIALDQAGHAYVNGSTASQDFPIYAAFQPTNAGPWYQPLDLFLCKFTAAGDAFVFSTYLGGSDYDFLGNLAVDWQGNVYVAAATFSTDFPQVKPLRGRNRHQDLVLAKFPPRGDSLLFSTYLGGVGNDWATSVALSPDGQIFLTGDTRSPDFPVVRPLQRFNASGAFDAIVVRDDDNDYV
ncbi:MAG: SBBP repeat-containing protein [bacterium]